MIPKHLFCSLLLAACSCLLTFVDAQAKSHDVARFFPRNTTGALIVNDPARVLNKLQQYGARFNRRNLLSMVWRDARRELRKIAPNAPKPRTWDDFFSLVGIAPGGEIGLSITISPRTMPAGLVGVIRINNVQRAYKLAAHSFAPDFIRELSRQCWRHKMRRRRTIRRLKRSGYNGPFTDARLFRHSPALRFNPCPAKGSYSTGLWARQLQKGLPKRKIRGGWLHGSAQTGFLFAIIQKRYLVFASHPWLLKQILIGGLRMSKRSRRNFRKLSSSADLHAHFSNQRFEKAIRQYLTLGRGVVPVPLAQFTALRTIFSSSQGLGESWGEVHMKHNRIEARAWATKTRGSFSAFAKIKPSTLRSIKLLPGSSFLVANHNLTQPLFGYIGKLLRQFSRIPSAAMLRTVAMLTDTWRLTLGSQMALGFVPGGRRSLRLALVVEVKKPKIFQQNLDDLQQVFGQRRKLFKSTQFQGVKLHHFHRRISYRRNPGQPGVVVPLVRQELAFALHKNHLILTLQDRARPLSLLKMLLSQRGPKPYRSLTRSAQWAGNTNMFFFLSFRKLLPLLQLSLPNTRSNRETIHAVKNLNFLRVRIKNRPRATHMKLDLRLLPARHPKP